MNRTPRGIKADTGYSYQKLEIVASGFRKCLGLSTLDKIHGLHLCDRLPTTVVNDIPYAVECGVAHLNGVEAEASFDAENNRYQILLTEETYDLLEAGKPHGTWVIVHEYAHVALHGGLLQRLANMNFQKRVALYKGTPVPHSFCYDTEWQTDSFTGAVLMPAAGIATLEENCPYNFFGGKPLSLEHTVSQHYGTSMQAAGYRVDTFRQRRAQLLAA
jgi:hypothetical protein